MLQPEDSFGSETSSELEEAKPGPINVAMMGPEQWEGMNLDPFEAIEPEEDASSDYWEETPSSVFSGLEEAEPGPSRAKVLKIWENVVPDRDRVNIMEPNIDSIIKLWLTVIVPAPFSQQNFLEARRCFASYSKDHLMQILQFLQRDIARQFCYGYLHEAWRYLEPNQYIHFAHSMLFDGEYQLSGWSDTQLRHLTVVLLQSPEAMIEKGSVRGIPVHAVYGMRLAAVKRALVAIRTEKLKRAREIFKEAGQDVLGALDQPNLPQHLLDFQKIVDFMEEFDVHNPNAM